MLQRSKTIFLAALIALAAACGTDDVVCRVGADCASGVCQSNGTCAPPASDGTTGGGTAMGFTTSDGGGGVSATTETTTGGEPDSKNDTTGEGSTGGEMTDTAGDSTTGGDASTGDATDGGDEGDSTGDGTGLMCAPNFDGVLTKDEVAFIPDVTLKYRIAQGATLSTEGTIDEDGTRIWDLASDLEGDADLPVSTLSVEGAWYLKDFPDATYAAQLSQSSDLQGVFQATDTALLLLGVVSPEDGFFATRLTLDPPVTVLQLPLEVGSKWSTETSVSGMAQGVVAFFSEDYSSHVDARGVLKTPFGNFDALRISIDLKRTIGLLTTRVKTKMFVAECFGAVATIVSQDNEVEPEFTSAAEVRRLTP